MSNRAADKPHTVEAIESDASSAPDFTAAAVTGFNPQRRRALKMATGAMAYSAFATSFPVWSTDVPLTGETPQAIDSAEELTALAKSGCCSAVPDLTINININRADLSDWVLLENLTESPLVLKNFSPQWVAYNGKLLDLNALLTRQQRGVRQLEIAPNYAWTHSVKGAVHDRAIDCIVDGCPIDFEQALLLPNKPVNEPGNRSLQLACTVDSAGRVEVQEMTA